MNIYDVSEHAGVSIATVSRVLNGNPNVSEKTREKVLKVMDELGYTPNVFARGLGLNTMKTIGIMCSDSSDPYLAGAIYYLERGLRAHGYDAILCCTGYDLDAKQKYFDLLRSKRVDAIILAGSKFVEMRAKDNAYIIEAASDLPIMLVNGFLEGENIYSTVCDDHAAVYGAASCSPPDAGASCMYTPAIPTAGSISWKDTKTPSRQRASRHLTNSSASVPRT
jgi:DNA-binding LacI/PurR family transcriptional regulator